MRVEASESSYVPPVSGRDPGTYLGFKSPDILSHFVRGLNFFLNCCAYISCRQTESL